MGPGQTVVAAGGVTHKLRHEGIFHSVEHMDIVQIRYHVVIFKLIHLFFLLHNLRRDLNLDLFFI